MHYYLYQITNLVNNKIYVGVHKTKDINDGYMGSGKVILHAIEKHGINNFRKDILETFENTEAMYAREKEIITDNFIAREDVYNLRRGGHGGFDWINKNITPEQKKYRNDRAVEGQRASRNSQSVNWFEGYRKRAESNSKNANSGLYIGNSKNFKSGDPHSEVASLKRKQTYNRIEYQQGKNNSQFGTMWITDGIISRKIKKYDSIPEGWRKGRIINSMPV